MTAGGNNSNNYRWVILVSATFGLVISNGMAISGIPVFYKPIQTELVQAGVIAADAAQTFIARASVLAFLMSGLFSFVGGWLLRRVKIKRLVVFGTILLGAGFVIHAMAESVGLIYFARFLMGTSLGFVGVTPSVILVSRWFGQRKGMALGILLTGTSIGGFLMPMFFAKLVEAYQWRTAMLIVSGMAWVILLPICLLMIREPAGLVSVPEDVAGPGLSFEQALRSSQFWLFAVAAALIFYTIFVTTQQFILYLQGPTIGLSLALASMWQSILFALSVSGKSAAGVLSDRFTSSRLTLVSTAMMFVSTMALLIAGAPLVFLILYGLGYGATFVLLQRLVAEYFGRRDYERILGAITMIEIVGGVAGGIVTGYLADRAGGDYTTAFYVMTLVTAAAFFCMLALKVLQGRSVVDASFAGDERSDNETAPAVEIV